MFEQARNGVCLDKYPVHLACRDGDVQSLTKFVGLRQDKSYLVEEDDFYHWTPLHFASFFGQLPALIALRETGISVDLTTAKFQQTAAHIAAFAGADHCLKYLVHFGCNVNKQDYLGETPLHKAARSGSVTCGRVLTADGGALPLVLNTSGQTPAGLAAACGHTEMAARLADYERNAGPQTSVDGAAVGPAQMAPQVGGARLPALNGGLVPERPAAADGPWCYQPPPRPSAVPQPGQMDTDGGGSASEGALEPGHFVVRHQTGELTRPAHQNGMLFSVSVGDRGGGELGAGWHSNGHLSGSWHGNGFGKRSSEEVFCEDIKRRRLLDYAGGDAARSVPTQLGMTTPGLRGPTGPCGRG